MSLWCNPGVGPAPFLSPARTFIRPFRPCCVSDPKSRPARLPQQMLHRSVSLLFRLARLHDGICPRPGPSTWTCLPRSAQDLLTAPSRPERCPCLSDTEVRLFTVPPGASLWKGEGLAVNLSRRGRQVCGRAHGHECSRRAARQPGGGNGAKTKPATGAIDHCHHTAGCGRQGHVSETSSWGKGTR